MSNSNLTIWFPDGFRRTADTADPYDVSATRPFDEGSLTDRDVTKLQSVYNSFEIDTMVNNKFIIRAKIGGE